MATKLPEAQSRVLEDGDAALIEGSTEKAEGAETVEYASLDEPTTAATAAPAASAADPEKAAAVAPSPGGDGDDIPEEYRGKTVKEIAKMHRDAQALIGRQGSELGDLRKRVDFAIQASLAGLQRDKQAPAPAKAADAPAAAAMDESEFFAKPQDAVSKMIENHPVIKEIRATLGAAAAETAQARASAATERFNAAHPDAPQILADPEFRQWVTASNVRRDLLQRANSRFDFDAGDEVFSTWKALKGVRTAAAAAAAAPAATAVSDAARTLAAARAAKTAQAAQAAAASAAAVPTGGASAGKETTGKKIYRRADVLRLMEEQPDRYEALADELTLAYKEGRVR